MHIQRSHQSLSRRSTMCGPLSSMQRCSQSRPSSTQTGCGMNQWTIIKTTSFGISDLHLRFPEIMKEKGQKHGTKETPNTRERRNREERERWRAFYRSTNNYKFIKIKVSNPNVNYPLHVHRTNFRRMYKWTSEKWKQNRMRVLANRFIGL